MAIRDKFTKESIKNAASKLGKSAYVSARRSIRPNEEDKRYLERKAIGESLRKTRISKVKSRELEAKTKELEERAKHAKAIAEIDKARSQSRKARSETYGGVFGGNFGMFDGGMSSGGSRSRSNGYNPGSLGGIGGDFNGVDLSMFDMSPRKKTGSNTRKPRHRTTRRYDDDYIIVRRR